MKSEVCIWGWKMIKKYCRDPISERLEDLVVVYANASTEPGFEAQRSWTLGPIRE